MQSLQSKASEWSGVSQADAFAIDEINLFQKLGLQTFINLSTNFYTRSVIKADIVFEFTSFRVKQIVVILFSFAKLVVIFFFIYK